MRRKVNYEIDMTNGPLLGKIIRFSISLMITNMLQLLYNAADLIVKMELFGGDAKGLYMLNSELKSRVYSAPSLVL